MMSASTCTPNIRNVCLGSESVLMELDHLSLAEYYSSEDATYPAIFGGRVKHPSQLPDPPVVETVSAAESAAVAEATTSSGYGHISQSCYAMLEK